MYAMKLRLKDVINYELNSPNVMDGSFFDPKTYIKDLRELKDDLSNVETVRENMHETMFNSV
jgi:hypothetical protein